MEYYAKKYNNNKQSLITHLNRVKTLCSTFADDFSNKKVGDILGGMHDIGKRTEYFQEVLEGKINKINHAVTSAIYLYNSKFTSNKELCQMLAYIVAAHHSELDEFINLNIPDFNEVNYTKDGKIISIKNKKEFNDISQYILDNNLLYELDNEDSFDISKMSKNEKMFYMRMLYSCLIDADYCASAEFENPDYINFSTGQDLNPNILLDKLSNYRNNIIKKSTSNPEMNKLRNYVYDQCSIAATDNYGLFTLTAPTGTAKTLALTIFALKNAIKFNRKRIIIVLPFLSIIEQTASIYKEIFGDDVILIDDSQTEYTEQTREFSDRWSSPIIITTHVKFFELLFKSKGTDCRKLHNLSNSIIMFDESHNLPTEILDCTIEIINSLNKYYNTTIVFSTATQSNYNFRKNITWKPKEIIEDTEWLYKKFSEVKNINVEWRISGDITLEDIANEMTNLTSCMCICNTKKQTKTLYEYLLKLSSNKDECFHISASMCNKHKLEKINYIKQRLENNLPCRLSSTSGLEAGVNIDFQFVYRELAPYSSLLQSAGRTARNANFTGHLIIFLPQGEKLYPSSFYENAANIVKIMHNSSDIDINNLEHIDIYSKYLYSSTYGNKDRLDICEDINEMDFIKLSKDYKLINNNQYQVIVPYEGCIKEYLEIKEKFIQNNYCITKKDIKFVSQFVVNSYDKEHVEKYCSRLYLSIKNEIYPSSFFILDNNLHLYTDDLGLSFDNINETNFII